MSWAILRLDSVWCSAGECAVAGCEVAAAEGGDGFVDGHDRIGIGH